MDRRRTIRALPVSTIFSQHFNGESSKHHHEVIHHKVLCLQETHLQRKKIIALKIRKNFVVTIGWLDKISSFNFEKKNYIFNLPTWKVFLTSERWLKHVTKRKFCIDFNIMKSSINFLKREHKMRKKNRYANHFFHRIGKIYLIFDFFSNFHPDFDLFALLPMIYFFFSSWSNFLCVYRSKGGEPEKALKKSMNLNNAQIKIHIVESAT